MFRKLLTTTAIVAVVSTGAIAQSMNNDAQKPAGGTAIFSTETPSTMSSQNGYFSASADQMLASDLIGSTVYAAGSAKVKSSGAADANTASGANSGMAAKPEANSGAKTATGADARENAAANANRDAKANRDANATMADDGPESLGDINDLLLASDGTIKAVIIGVGGFLGIGEKAVAVDISRISAVEQDGERWLMLEASKEELENAPEFTAEEDRTAEASDNTQRQAMNERAATDTNKMDKTADANDRMQNDKAAAKADDRAAENQTVDVTKLSAEELIGTQVYGAENEVIGEVSDVVLDGKQQVEAFIVDVGGFLGIGEKPVALDAAKLQISKDEDGDLTVHTSFTEARLEKQKAYSEEAYKSDKDSVMLR